MRAANKLAVISYFRSPCLLERPASVQDDRTGAPAVLWSFAGSGNTMVRQLLELATGRFTGSKYHDGDLARIFPREMTPVGTQDECAADLFKKAP